jgi:hypothetical protein
MAQRTMFGAGVPVGLQAMKDFTALKLGECALTLLPMDKAEALAVARYCRERRIRLYFSEILWRGDTDKGFSFAARRRMPRSDFYTKAEMDEIIDAAGQSYGGRMTIGEFGGVLYLPKAYLTGRRAKSLEIFSGLPAVQRVDQARDAYIKYLKRFIEYERREIGKGPLLDVDSALVFKYHAQAGIDILCLEAMPGDPHLMHAAVRGAARAYNKPWGTHIALVCYGGMNFDELWMKRWKTSFYHAYLCGAGFVWPECGYYDYDQRRGQKFDFHSPQMKRARRVMRECYQFSRVHTRPDAAPTVTLGVVYGNLDGAPGLWNRYAWGQFRGKKWLENAADRGWRLVDKFHRREDWPKETVQGERDFSGNPPYGQYDVVPIEAPLSVLKSYRCLVFLAWNTMTDEIYDKLKSYVRAGGHLVMWLPHLSVETDRGKPVKLYRNGDFRDLFGVSILGKGRKDVRGIKCMAKSSLPEYGFPFWRTDTDPRFLGGFTPSKVELAGARVISAHDDFYHVTPEKLAGRPVLTEHTLGKGKAFLVSAWEYPADEGLLPFTEDVLRTVLAGEQGRIRLLGSDRVRYAVYGGLHPAARGNVTGVYLLNTDPDNDASVRLWIEGRLAGPFEVPANALRIVYCLDALVLAPEEPLVDFKSVVAVKDRTEIEFYSVNDQRVEAQNIGDAAWKVSVNGRARVLQPGERRPFTVRRRADPARREFFALDFLDEPFVQPASTMLPY